MSIPNTLTTTEAAKALHRSAQTLRKWACTGSGPIQPVRIGRPGGPLLWRVSDIEALFGQSEAEEVSENAK